MDTVRQVGRQVQRDGIGMVTRLNKREHESRLVSCASFANHRRLDRRRAEYITHGTRQRRNFPASCRSTPFILTGLTRPPWRS